MPDNVKKLYDRLVADQYEMPSFEEFAADMKDNAKRQRLYGNISAEYELPDFETFSIDMGVGVPVGEALQAEAAGSVAVGQPAKKKVPGDGSMLQRPTGERTGLPSSDIITSGEDFLSRFSNAPGASSSSSEPLAAKPIKDVRREAMDFIVEDYRKNKESIDRSITRTQDNPFGTVHKPVNFMDAGPLGSLVDPKGDTESFRRYTQERLWNLEQEHKRKMEDLDKRFPEEESYLVDGNAYIPTGRIRPKGYDEEKKAVTNEYTALKQKLMTAASVLGNMKAYNEQLKKATPEQIAKGEFLNVKEMGKTAMRIISDPTDKHPIAEEIDKMERYEKQGIPVTAAQKALVEKAGLDAAQLTVYEQMKDAEEKGQPISQALQTQLKAVQNATKKFWTDHDDFRKEQVINAISNEVAREKGGWKMFTDLGVTDDDLKKAAKKLGLPDEAYADIKTGDIKQQNAFGAFGEGYLSTVSSIGGFFTSRIRRAMGQSEDWIDYATGESKRRFNNLGGVLGTNPEIQSLFNPLSEVETDPTSTNFLFNKPADPKKAGKFSWNAAGIINTVANATGMLAAYSGGGALGRTLGASADAAMMSTLFTSTYDHNYQAAKEMGIKDENSASGYAFVRSLTNAFIFTKLIPHAKIENSLFNPVNEAGKNLFQFIEKQGMDKVTKAAMKPLVRNVIAETVKDTGKVLAAAELDKAADFVTAAAIDPHSIDERDFLKESAHEGLSLALATVIPAAMGANRRQNQMSSLYKNMIYDMGTRPEPYIQAVYKSMQEGNIARPEAEANMKTIASMARAVSKTPDYSSLSEKPLSERQKQDYTVNLVRDNMLREKLELVKDDPIQKKLIESELTELSKSREELLKNAEGEGVIEVTNVQPGEPQRTPSEEVPGGPAAEPVAPRPEPPKTPTGGAGETRPVETEFTGTNHPVMSKAEFRGLKPGDKIFMETPAGKVVADEIAEVSNGEVKLKNTGVFRNETVTDPNNVGMRFVNPVQNEAAVETTASPKTSTMESPAQNKAGETIGDVQNTESANIQPNEQIAAIETARANELDAVVDAASGKKARDIKRLADAINKKYDDQLTTISSSNTQGGSNAIQEQSSVEEVLRGGDAGSELPPVGEGNNTQVQKSAQQEATQTQGAQEITGGLLTEVNGVYDYHAEIFNARNNVPVTALGKEIIPYEERKKLAPHFAGKIVAGEDQLITDDLIGKHVIQSYDGTVHKVVGKRGKGTRSDPFRYELQNITDGGITTEPVNDAGRARKIYQPVEVPEQYLGPASRIAQIESRLSEIAETERVGREIGQNVPDMSIEKSRLQKELTQLKPNTNETTTQTGASGRNATEGAGTRGGQQENAQTVRDAEGETVSETAGETAQESNSQQAGAGPNKKSSARTKEEEIKSRLKDKKKAFLDALKKSRGKLSMNALDPDVIKNGIEMLAVYAELGYHKFSQIARDLIKTLGKEFTREDVDALRGVYAYERSLRTKEERLKMESDEVIDTFYEQQLPKLFEPAPKIPLEIKLGKEATSYKYIGNNQEGLPLYENSEGVRAVQASTAASIYTTEPVGIMPTRSGIETFIGNRSNEYKTIEEIEKRPLEAELVERQLDTERGFIDRVKNEIVGQNKIGIVQLRSIAKEIGLQVKDTHLQELVEASVVELIRDHKAGANISDSGMFDYAVQIYNQQPTISMRSSERVALQQYSTPAPISFVAGMYVGHKNPDLVFEPSAGNGLMTIYFPAGKVHANEIDPVRISNLQRLGFAVVTTQDATKPFASGIKYGGVVTNPPFGSAEVKDYDGYKIKGLDEQMIINALNSMADNGRAAMIQGGHTSYDEKGRLKADRTFFNYLYNHYNVADVINIDGSLYAKQGTSFPVRMILIDGRKATPNGAAPLKSSADDVVTSFPELFKRIQKLKNLDLYGTVFQPRVDDGRGSSDPLYGADAKTALEQAGSDTGVTGAPSAASATIPATSGNTVPNDPGQATAGSSSLPGSGRVGAGGSNTQQRPNANGNQSVSSPGTGQPGGSAAEGNRATQTNGGDRGISGNNPQQVPTSFDATRIAAEKVPYIPRSRSKSVGSVVPTQMASEIERVLDDVSRETGGIDEFVRTELNYPDMQSLYKALSAEQIDAVAMGIRQIQNGQSMIIGDQTGVGKGRIAASMIRWAVGQGHKPILLTEKANLFSDFYRDMIAIGSADLVPFIVNDKSASADPTITDEQGNVLYKTQPAGVKKTAFANGELPGDTNFVMATYSQFSDSKETVKKQFLRQIAAENVIITDESHNMSGDSNTGVFFQSVLSMAKGGMYLSATFAKRPDNMPIYAVKTAMSEANMTKEDLISAIQKGGVALQEVVSAELAQAGQMLRRERDFTGVTIDYEVLDEKAIDYQERVDNVTAIMRDVIAFQDAYIKPLIDAADDAAKAEGSLAQERQGTSMAGADNVPFASKVFQVVHQLLFALKSNDIADAAIQELKANRKPVIGFNSTMESFFNYMGLQPGDTLGKADFSLSILRGLEGTMRYTVKDAGGNSIPKSFSFADLPTDGQEMYSLIRSKIQNAVTGIPISPIDAIVKRIQDAGYTVKEITGRGMMMEYDDQGGGKIVARTERNKNKISREFNNGELDVIMINASGSTGLSLHASETFKDKRQRTMISGQLELDVNTEVQKRGRIDRTGQVARGRYRYIVSPIPAEKRLLMMFRSKLKSLDANTTSSQKQKTSDVAVVDFLNHHGDQVVLEFLAANQQMNLSLRDPLKLLEKTEEDVAELKAKGGEARMVTGRVALLPSAQQEKFYNEITDMYARHIDMLESLGQNDLEVKAMPLEAKTISSQVIIEGKGGTSPFGQNSILQKVEANVLRKPLTQAELTTEIQKSLAGRSPEQVSDELIAEAETYLSDFMERGRREIRERHEKLRAEADDWVNKKAAKQKTPPTAEEMKLAFENRIAELEQAEGASLDMYERREGNNMNLILARMNFFKIGKPYGVPTSLNADVSNQFVPGIFLGFEIGSSTENRFRPSNITMRFATPLGSVRMIKVPLSRANYINAVIANTQMQPPSEWQGLAENWETRARTQDRGTRYIVSGNILQGYNYAPGQLVSYTTDAGELRKGVLLSEDWKPEKDAVTRVPISRAKEHLDKTGMLQSSNNEVSIERASSGFTISVPASKVSGGKYYLNKELRNLVSGKDFRQTGGRFVAQFSNSKLDAVLDILQSEFNLAVNIPKLNFQTTNLPKELQAQHDIVVYENGTTRKTDLLQRAGAEVAKETESISVNDQVQAPEQNLSLIAPRSFAQDFVEQAVISHAGYEIKSHRDIADLFALYRSPHIEKSHLVFMKDGVIVANHAITSNSPTETPAWLPSEIAMLATGYGATEVMLVHNHPSGNPDPSPLDLHVTNRLANMLPQRGVNFKGHVILNGNKYSFLDGKRSNWTTEEYTSPQTELFSPRYKFSEDALEFQSQAVDVAHHILKENTKGQTGIVYLDTEARVAGYDLVAPNATAQEIIDTIRNGLIPNGSASYYIASENPNPALLQAELPSGMLGEITLNGGVRGGAEFKTEPENLNENILRAPRRTASVPPGTPPAPNTGQAPAPFTVELSKTSRVKEFAKKTKRNITELFAVGGGIEKHLRDIKEAEIGNFNELKAKARHIQQDYEHAIRQNYGKKKLSSAENEVLDKALKGDQAAMQSLAAPVQAVVTKMRNYIDYLTERLIEAGVIPAADDLRAQIQDHLDQSANAGVEPNQGYLSMLNTKLAFAEKIENNIGSYVNRAYLKYRVENWRDKVSQETINAATNYIYNEGLLQGRQMTEEQVTGIIEDILKSGSIDHLMTASKFAVNFNILKKMKEIPAPIRDLMGEVKEAEWNFMNTVTKMASLLERHKFLKSFHDAAVGKFFERTRDAGKGFTTQVNQPSWGPLNGIWTTPELADALKEWDGEKVDHSMAMKAWRDINGLSKSMKTTLSWVSELRNMIGNISLTMFNGNFNPMHYRKGMLALGDALNKVKGDEARLYVEKMNRLRIIGSSLPYHEIRGIVNELTASLPELSTDDPMFTKKIWLGALHLKNKAAEIYGATDDIYKIMTWEMEKSRLTEAYQKSGVNKTTEEIEQEAADIALRIMPTFSKVPKIVKTMAYNTPIIGTFISYPAELMRTTYNSVVLSTEQLRSDNPEIRKIGAKRLAWHLGTAALPFIVAGIAGLLIKALGYGLDDEEEDAILKLLPEFYKNENVVVWKKNGKYYVWMGSGWDGHSYLRETVNAAVRGDGDFGAAGKALAEPFAQPTLPLQKIKQYVENKDQFDRKIILDADDQDEKAVKTFKHFGDLVAPQTGKDLLKPVTDFSKGNEEKGWLGVLKLATGQQVLEIDPAMALSFKLRDLNDEKRDINEKARYDLGHGKSAEEVNQWVNGKLQKLQAKFDELAKLHEILK